MKTVLAVGVLPLWLTIASFAQADAPAMDVASNNTATWSRLVGVITGPNFSNKVAGVDSGTTPWTTTSGSAFVQEPDKAAFTVTGLVLVGGNTSGTPGKVTSVKGTLVCNAGAPGQVAIDTPAVPLSGQGNAHFAGSLESSLPSFCGNPIFLIRVVPKNVWIATGAVRVIN